MATTTTERPPAAAPPSPTKQSTPTKPTSPTKQSSEKHEKHHLFRRSNGTAPATSNRRLTVILHGKRADDLEVREAVKKIRASGVQIDVKVTWEAGDVERIVAAVVKEKKSDTIVAAGGDGTLNEVVWALLKADAPQDLAVGLLPLGTSNDFAAVTGLPTKLRNALQLCTREDNLRPIDVGLLNGAVFMNTATLGASSELGSETTHEAKCLLGPAAYLVKGVAKLAEYDTVDTVLRFPAAGQDPRLPREQQKVQEVHEELLNLTAGNSRQIASMLQPCPDALLDDGLLDITYFVGTPAQKAAELVEEVLSKGLDGAEPQGLRMLRVPWLEVECKEKVAANRDGEAVEPSATFKFEVLHRRIMMHLPDDRLLIDGAGENNQPIIKEDNKRLGVLKDMVAQVTRFKRTYTGPPWWQKNAIGILRSLFIFAAGFGTGYLVFKGNNDDEAEYERANTTSSERKRKAKETAREKVGYI